MSSDQMLLQHAGTVPRYADRPYANLVGFYQKEAKLPRICGSVFFFSCTWNYPRQCQLHAGLVRKLTYPAQARSIFE